MKQLSLLENYLYQLIVADSKDINKLYDLIINKYSTQDIFEAAVNRYHDSFNRMYLDFAANFLSDVKEWSWPILLTLPLCL